MIYSPKKAQVYVELFTMFTSELNNKKHGSKLSLDCSGTARETPLVEVFFFCHSSTIVFCSIIQ